MMTDIDMPRRIATVKEACKYAKMGHTKLYEKINAGAIKAFKRGVRTLIDLDSIDEMNAREMVPWKSGAERPSAPSL